MDIHGTNFKFVPYLKIKIIGEGGVHPSPLRLRKKKKGDARTVKTNIKNLTEI